MKKGGNLKFFAHSIEGKPVEEWQGQERVEWLLKWFVRAGLSLNLGKYSIDGK